MSRPGQKASKPLSIPFSLNLIHLLSSTLAGIDYLKIFLFSRYLGLASSPLVGIFPPGIHAFSFFLGLRPYLSSIFVTRIPSIC